jgi:ribosome-associated protein
MTEADDSVLRVTPSCAIRRSELQWRFSGSGGPGGQHANTANTRVELVFDVVASPSLGPRQRERVVAALGPEVRIVVATTRSQARNRDLAVERLTQRLRDALRITAPRRPTAPSRSARAKRVDDKRRRGERKAQRRRPDPDS